MSAGDRFSLLLVCHSYPPVIGGSEIEAQRVCEALRKNGHRVEVVCCGGPPMPAQARWVDPVGVPVRICGSHGRWGTYIYTLGVLHTLWSERRNYDLVYFLMPGLQVLAGLPLARLLSKPVVMKFSGSNEVRKLTFNRMGRLELGLLKRWASRVLLLNEAMFAEAAEAGLPESLLEWMPNPVDMQQFAPPVADEKNEWRRRYRVSPEGYLVTYIGRLAREKELGSLLAGFARVAAARPEVQLILVGDGPERRSLEELARTLQLSGRVLFVGMVDPSQVRWWLQASDAFALVSRLEGLPVSLLEAMAVGLPSIVSDIPANRQLIDNDVSGWVVRMGEEAEIGAAIGRLAENPARGVEMGKMGRARVYEQFSIATVVQRYERLFGEMLGEMVASKRAGG